nr:hypothetical protein [Candidatus Aminicenantes bacterium]NIM77893.1 hypothetical protein [Candidatus Aminicenantes bacterium]NIN17206.1 hypothetical protein [Candidatus Aminicenantes bacterium]NIN41099.1 hypothetical protein [Candidatus Aminicenantes bacterium]NIN83904.1 hypothetical protein [Candidatus Aminicenantes bacterium]
MRRFSSYGPIDREEHYYAPRNELIKKGDRQKIYFGSMVGSTIGISLYFSQAISVAFYMIAFSEAFTPAFAWIQSLTSIVPQTWMISIPATLLLLVLIL